MILIVASQKDPASLNIKKQLLINYPFTETPAIFQGNITYQAQLNEKDIQLITLEEELIYAEDLPEFFINPGLIVFISRHSSASGKPTLSVHTPGNLGPAELGGKPRQVSISPANAMREALKTMAKMKDEMKLNYEVSYEATHHGPSLYAPTMFVELGSSPQQWSDATAALAVAHAAINAATNRNDSPEIALGIGGPHYNSKFTKIALETNIAFGHIIPKYAISHLDENILQQCIERTFGAVKTVVLDWKGIKGEDKPGILDLLNEQKLHVQKV